MVWSLSVPVSINAIVLLVGFGGGGVFFSLFFLSFPVISIIPPLSWGIITIMVSTIMAGVVCSWLQ